MSEPNDLKAILTSVFRRRGANGRYTRLFDDLDESQKQTLLQCADLGSDELPIIGSVEAPDRWLILTTRRIEWSRANVVNTLPVEKILDAVVDLHALQRSGRTKLEMRELLIKTTNGQYAIEVEPGQPLSGVWNVLKGIGAGNRKR